jgi:hypothetical protein
MASSGNIPRLMQPAHVGVRERAVDGLYFLGHLALSTLGVGVVAAVLTYSVAVLAPVLSVPRHENGPLDIDRDSQLSRADCRWTALGISIRSPLSASGYALDVGCASSGHYLLDPVCAATVCSRFGSRINKGRAFLRTGLSASKPLF